MFTITNEFTKTLVKISKLRLTAASGSGTFSSGCDTGDDDGGTATATFFLQALPIM
jgi:hypothetical protein